jgi:hypothetical protein
MTGMAAPAARFPRSYDTIAEQRNNKKPTSRKNIFCANWEQFSVCEGTTFSLLPIWSAKKTVRKAPRLFLTPSSVGRSPFGHGSDGRSVYAPVSRQNKNQQHFGTHRADARALPPFPPLRFSLSARSLDLSGCRLK